MCWIILAARHCCVCKSHKRLRWQVSVISLLDTTASTTSRGCASLSVAVILLLPSNLSLTHKLAYFIALKQCLNLSCICPSNQCTVQVKLELGHRAQLRKKVTSEGFTHDWMVFVRGPETGDIQHFVDKVVFRLHESFPKPKRGEM